jgi:DnaK suppressor protein
MQSAELENSKTVLMGLLRDIERPMRRKDEIAVDNPPDTIDRVQHAAERELAIRQIESDFNRLRSIRLALQRIEDGSYGTCVNCEGEIGVKRLRALPWAAHCVKCQEIADREVKEAAGEDLVRTA